MWRKFAERAQQLLRLFGDVAEEHPVWSERPYVVLLYAPGEIRGRIHYIESNPSKEGLPRQHWPFVKPYDGWPFTKRTATDRP